MVAVEAIAYTLPSETRSLEELHAAGLIDSAPESLRQLGFEVCRVSSVPADVLAEQTIRQLLTDAGVAPQEIGLLVNATALPSSALVRPQPGAPLLDMRTAHLDTFKYTSMRLVDSLGLVNARTLGLSELSCISMMSAVWTARSLMLSDGAQYAICVSADVFPAGMKREVVYNLVSDSACAVLLKKDGVNNRVTRYGQMSKGYYYDCEARQNELIAAYFPTAKRIVQKTLSDAGLTLADIDLVIPHNVSLRSWEILQRMLEIPAQKLFSDNIRTKAHSIAADNFINYKDALASGRLKKGQRALLFCFGLGAHWGCSIVEA